MYYSGRVWLGAAIAASAIATIVGVASIEYSPYLALSAFAPFALLIAALFVYAAIRGQQWALSILFIVIILVLATDLRGGTGGFREEAIDEVVLFKFGLFLMGFVVGLGTLHAVQRRILTMPAAVIFLYLGWATIASGFSSKPILSLAAAFGLANWIFFAIALNERLRPPKLILLVISAGTVFCIGSLIAFIFYPEFGQYVSFGSARLTGLAGAPNEAAQISALTLVAIVAFYVSGYHRTELGSYGKWWIVTTIFVAVAVLLLTLSRGALAGAIVAVVAISLQRIQAARGAFLIGIVAATIVALAFLISPKPLELLAELATGVSRSGGVEEVWTFAGRTRIWSFVIEQIGENPIAGVGYGQGSNVLRQNYVPPWGLATGSAHNAFLHTMLDIGLPGGVLLAAAFLWSIREFFRNPSPFRDGIFIIVLFTALLESSVSKATGSLSLYWLVSLFFQQQPTPTLVRTRPIWRRVRSRPGTLSPNGSR